MKRLVSLTAVVTVLLLVTPALAGAGGFGPRHGGPHGGPGMHLMSPGALPLLSEALELSPEQRARIEALFTEMRPQPPGDEVREQMRSLGRQLHELWQEESPDRSAILAKLAEIDALRAEQRAERRNQRISLRLALLEVLTPEQRAELAELGEQMRERRPGRHGRRGPRHGRPCGGVEPDVE